MNTKLISPKNHALMDYVLVGSLLIVPALLKFNKKARNIYAAEALALLPYVALTKQPLAAKGIIPFKTHGKIDALNVGLFALKTLFKPFQKSKKVMLYNIAFTTISGLSVLLTDWKASK